MKIHGKKHLEKHIDILISYHQTKKEMLWINTQP